MNVSIRFTRRWVMSSAIVGGALVIALFMTGAAQTLIERADKGPISATQAPKTGVAAAVRASVGTSNQSFIGLGMITLYVIVMAFAIAAWIVASRQARRRRDRGLVAVRGREWGGAKPLPIQRF